MSAAEAVVDPAVAPVAAAARAPYAPMVIESRPGFDPARCTPEQWAALVWMLNQSVDNVLVVDDEQAAAIQARITVTPTRISAEEPRTGDCLELPFGDGSPGRRYFYVKVDAARVIADPVAWRLLCRVPGCLVHLGGLAA